MTKKYDYVLGQNSYDCGIASIITILMHYGIRPSREEIISSFNKTNLGYTAYDLIKIANNYDISGYGLKTNLDRINSFPVIAHTIKDKNMFHFIVIFEKNNDKKLLTVMDPSCGIRVLSFSEFENITTGIFLLFEGTGIKNKRDMRLKKELIKIFQSNKRIILKTLFLSVIYVIFSLIFNHYLKFVLAYNTNKRLLFSIFITFIVIDLFKNSLNYFKNKLMLELSLIIDKDITKRVTNHIFNLPYKYFISKTTGELVTILDDIENFKQIITKVFVLMIVDIILICFILLYLLALNYYYFIIVFFVILILFIITKKYQYIFNDKYLNLKTSKIEYNSDLISFFTSFESIKNLNISSVISRVLSKKYLTSTSYDKSYNQKIYNYEFINSIIIDFFYLLVIFLFIYYSFFFKIDLYDIVLYSSIFLMITSLITNVNESYSLFKVYQTSTNRVLDCLALPREIFGNTKFDKINTIEFRDVNYKIEDLCHIVDVNLKINLGEKIYITGESGIGKSTLMKMLIRYITPNEGSILIDGININNIDLSFIRNKITYVGQNESLFSGSIKENLKFVSSDDCLIKEVSNITLLTDLYKKNNISDSFYIEENGANLSGGERKKIILTRGLLHFKEVLILDEVFNEISVEEEEIILKNIFDKYKDKIVILISHRQNNMNLFDKKYIFEGDGSIHEIN